MNEPITDDQPLMIPAKTLLGWVKGLVISVVACTASVVGFAYQTDARIAAIERATVAIERRQTALEEALYPKAMATLEFDRLRGDVDDHEARIRALERR